MCMLNGANTYVALILAFLAGMLAGLVTGLFHTALGIPPILAGILTQLGLYSINMRIMGKANPAISVMPVSYTHLDVYKRQVYTKYEYGKMCIIGVSIDEQNR